MNSVSLSDAWYPESQRDRYILEQLVLKDFKLKYRRSAMGIVWSVLNPLLMMCVMAAAFSKMIGLSARGIPNYPLYIILGNTAFAFVSESTSAGMGSIIGASSLLKKVKISRWIFPVEKVFFAGVNYIFSMFAVALVMMFFRITPTWHLLLFPLLILYMTVFNCGLSLLLSSLTVFFRDIMHLWSVFLTAWTYATPLFYPQELLPEWMISLERFNPMYLFVTYIRDLFLYQQAPSVELNLACALCAVVSLVVGLAVFRKTERRFILYI